MVRKNLFKICSVQITAPVSRILLLILSNELTLVVVQAQYGTHEKRAPKHVEVPLGNEKVPHVLLNTSLFREPLDRLLIRPVVWRLSWWSMVWLGRSSEEASKVHTHAMM